MNAAKMLGRPRTWFIAVPVLVLLVAVVGPFVYINFIQDDAPERLTFADTTGTTGATSTGSGTASAEGLDGKWAVTDGSQAGYRVKEVLFGQDAEAVGRTSEVTGQLDIDGKKITAGSFTVDMTSVASDQSRRDGQFHGRIMETSRFPTATFTQTQPISLSSVPADGEQVTIEVMGDFTIHGTTKSVTFALDALRQGTGFQVKGVIPVKFADFGIPSPSFGPATVQDHGEIEFLLVFGKA